MKKLLKGILIAVLVVVLAVVALIVVLIVKGNIDAQKPLVPDDYYTEFKSDFALEKKYSGLGSYEVASADFDANDKSIVKYRVWYPKELESKNEESPLILVTNASNLAALNYEPFFKRLASWGFVVAGNEDRQAGSGKSTSLTLDYVLKLNDKSDSVFYKKIDQTKIGVVGYSQGGAGAIRAATEFENSNKITTMFTGSAAYAKLAKNMGWEYDATKISIPYFMVAGTGQTDDSGKYGEDDYSGVAPLFSLKENYANMSNDVNKIYARAVGAEHEDMLKRSDGYMTAWMCWQLKNDVEAKNAFYGASAEILINTAWQDIQKNI